MMTKNELRILYKQKRANLRPIETEGYSIAIANQLLTLPIWDFSYYHIFLTIQKQNEVNTEFILPILAGKDKEIVVSQSNFQTMEMTHFLLTDHTTIRLNAFQIPEPQDGLVVPNELLDVVFVPLLAFDTHGNRVGYGKGFYDKMLKKCRDNVLKIGLSFFEPENQIANVSDTDIRLDCVVTPKMVYPF
ncbi:5-formyltetrahydrofolate cyclo-ligase [Flavobacterium branchiophilum]|uniref:5-formyltetrahydrofolate cyclo-ligase n=1 Tax=Flavobacterium branchiophilum TaxID=55197 RepID=A0A2H3KUH3_9FLAO|nr:5-formyltetrahydrofolate cyclo-ligase [Flavobacterium branchiophilum]PDS26608.1 5-formyltetrahydrofolate cyclo-ligase [Flavobacterium branchiophilum]